MVDDEEIPCGACEAACKGHTSAAMENGITLDSLETFVESEEECEWVRVKLTSERVETAENSACQFQCTENACGVDVPARGPTVVDSSIEGAMRVSRQLSSDFAARQHVVAPAMPADAYGPTEFVRFGTVSSASVRRTDEPALVDAFLRRLVEGGALRCGSRCSVLVCRWMCVCGHTRTCTRAHTHVRAHTRARKHARRVHAHTHFGRALTRARVATHNSPLCVGSSCFCVDRSLDVARPLSNPPQLRNQRGSAAV